jgi:hypothetical protein
MGTIVFGSPEAAQIRQRDAELERLESAPLHRYTVSGEVIYWFETTVEARSLAEAQKIADQLDSDSLDGLEDASVIVLEVADDGLVKADDPEEQERDRTHLERESQALPPRPLLEV